MSTTDVPLTRFGRRQTKGVLLGFTAGQVGAVGAAGLLLAVGGAVDHLLPAFAVAVLLSVVVFVRWQGRPLVEWTGVGAVWLVRVVTGQTRYRARPFEPRPVGTMALPGDAAALRFVTTEDGVAMIHDPHRSTLTAVCQVSYPAFVLLDGHAQARRVNGWGRVQAVQAALGRTATMQVLESAIPDPGRGVVGWWEANGVRGAAALGSGWAAENYEERMRLHAPASAVHRTLIAVSLDMRKARSEISRAGRGVKGAAAVMTTDITQLTSALARAELTVDRWLDEGHLAAVIRGAFDPAVDVDPTNPAMMLQTAGPMAIDEHWDHLVHDSGVSVVLWISQWPTTEVIPNFMHQLIFERGVRRTLSLFMRPIPAAEAARAVRSEKVDYITDRAQKVKIGQVLDASDDDEYRDVLARERALNEGHADMRYTGLIAVTAATLEEARQAAETVRRAANACAMETQLLAGRQAQGFIACNLPLARAIA